ncbi:hypothetical protein [Sphingomonas sp. Leaf25]|uniref:hypothetical protein n=1 Tax=Sphingomonas sp. Leaf25 TaxID=1735692 RepID=UPI000A7C5D50|nr:hypothetical protein [Sphingomonas sp. Leaf25]
MRRMVLVAALGVVAQPAVACTVSSPYRPLTARPAGTQTALLVDVVSLDLRRYPAIATVRIVRGDKPATRTIPYWRAICGGRRDPAKGERLVVYLRGSDALGWATPAEAKRLERSFG